MVDLPVSRERKSRPPGFISPLEMIEEPKELILECGVGLDEHCYRRPSLLDNLFVNDKAMLVLISPRAGRYTHVTIRVDGGSWLT